MASDLSLINNLKQYISQVKKVREWGRGVEGHEIINVIVFPGLGADGTSLEHK